MMEVVRSAVVARPVEQVFALVEHAEDYPTFLPWCTEGTILERRDDYIRARVGFGFGGVRASMLSEVDRRAYESMDVRIAGWPFDRFEGRWRFEPLGAAGCRVTFTARTDFSDAWWGRMLRFAAGVIADRLVAAFVDRARRLPPPAPSG